MLRRRRRREPVVLPVPSASATSSGLNLDPAPSTASAAVAVPTTATSTSAAANPRVPEQEQTLFKDLRSTVDNISSESKRIPPKSELIEPKLKCDWSIQDPTPEETLDAEIRVN